MDHAPWSMLSRSRALALLGQGCRQPEGTNHHCHTGEHHTEAATTSALAIIRMVERFTPATPCSVQYAMQKAALPRGPGCSIRSRPLGRSITF